MRLEDMKTRKVKNDGISLKVALEEIAGHKITHFLHVGNFVFEADGYTVHTEPFDFTDKTCGYLRVTNIKSR